MDRRFAAGGSRALAQLIDEHGEALVSDLLHYYGVDLRDLFSDSAPLSPRYLLCLVLNLPTDSAFYASRLGGPQYRGWDAGRYALVGLLNAQNVNNHILSMVNRDPKKPKPKPPEPFPTPDQEVKTKQSKVNSFTSIAAKMMAAQRRKRELISGR